MNPTIYHHIESGDRPTTTTRGGYGGAGTYYGLIGSVGLAITERDGCILSTEDASPVLIFKSLGDMRDWVACAIRQVGELHAEEATR